MKKSYPIISPKILARYSDIELPGRAELVREIQDGWSRIQIRAIHRGFRRVSPKIPRSMEIFGTGLKTGKGEYLDSPVDTLIWYGSPGRESGIEMCDNRSPACTSGCLGHGCARLRMKSGRNSKLWKTMLLVGDPDRFIRLMMVELEAHIARCHRENVEPAARIDGSTDTGIADTLSGFDRFRSIKMYDYSKSTYRMHRFLSGSFTDNRHLTYSRSENNHRQSIEILNRGGTVAVPVDCNREEFPSSWCGFPVEDGDRHDVRYRDTPGTWQFLTWKGDVGKDTARNRGFLVSC